MTATADRQAAPGRRRPRHLLLAGVGTLGLGMAITIGGVVVPLLFVPGTWITGAGLALLAAAGVLGIVAARVTS